MTKNEAFEGKGMKFTMFAAPIMFAKITEENMDDYEGKLRFKVTIVVDSEMGPKMEENGFNVKQDDDGNYLVDAYKLRITGKGDDMKTNGPPDVVFADGTKWDYKEHGGIGNGTIADVEVFAKYVKVGKEWRLPLYLNKIILVDFVAYNPEKTDAKSLF